MIRKRMHTILCSIALTVLCLRIFIPAPVLAETVRLPIRAAVCINCPPYQLTDENGDAVGMHIDILEMIAEHEHLRFEYVPFDTQGQCVEALNAGTVDIVVGAPYKQSNNMVTRSTSELSSAYLCLLARDTVETDESRANYSKYTFVSEFGLTSNSMVSTLTSGLRYAVSNQIEVFQMLASGKAQYAVGDSNSLLYQAYMEGASDQYTVVQNYLGRVSYTILVGENDHHLLNVLETGLTEVRTSGEYSSISARWLIDEKEERIRRITHIAVIAGSILATGILLYVFISSRVQTYMKNQIEKQGIELREANEELQHRLEKIHRQSELRNSLIEQSPDAMVLFDTAYKVTLMNRAACLLTGTEDIPAERRIMDLPVFSDLLRIAGADLLHPGFSMQDQVIESERNGEKRSYACSMYQIIDHHEVTGVLAQISDVTEEEQRKRDAIEQEKQRVLNRTIAGIAHEIKNPLSAISAFSSLIRTQGTSSDFLQAFEEFVPAEVDRINKLVENLIQYARPAKGVFGRVEVKQLLENSVLLVSGLADKNGIDVCITGDDTACVKADPDQLKQVFINLFMNGIESMEQKAKAGYEGQMRFEATVTRQDGTVFIRLYDEGLGMREEDIQQSTELFYTTKEHGSGIGLSLSSQYIHENDGSMKITSEPGKYCLITLSFPEYL